MTPSVIQVTDIFYQPTNLWRMCPEQPNYFFKITLIEAFLFFDYFLPAMFYFEPEDSNRLMLYFLPLIANS